ncbi:ABC transporter ATP-binding protein [Sporichthya sp.]|uniref:ABC transporter ATP-binding protein n=1 Tax=Sporichthya sp. TaxID=65475 RepID=UPI0017A1C703|nr:ABC transporter ATP-binding protein [Sporichthya sp.]MBA3743358.1 ABC transporter ATP-binding protein [Sporichthya sp.]
MLIPLLREHLRPYRRLLIAVVALQFGSTLAALYLPTLNADLIDKGIVAGDTGHIMRVGAVMLGVTAIQMLAAIAAVYVGARIAMSVGRDLRAGVFGRVQTFSGEEIARFGAPSLITRTTNDAGQVQAFLLLAFTMAVPAPVSAIGGIALALHQDVPLSSVLLVVLPLLVLSVAVIIRAMRPLFRQMQVGIDSVNRILREQITGVRVIRAFVRDEHESDRFSRANADLREVSLGTGRLLAMMFPIVLLVVNAASVSVLWFGGHRIDDGGMQLGALTAFLSYLMQILFAVMMATFTLSQMPRAEVCAERITEVLATEATVVVPTDGVTSMPTPGGLELRGVDFRFPGAEQAVLHGVDLTAVRGGVTAIVGGTGSGKSTLCTLIPRLVDPSAGAVLVGGVNARELDPAALARAVGYVPQRPFLFSGTVATNLAFGRPDATEDEMWAALTTAQAADFVRAMPTGLQSPIAQGGSNVSGGQRQRLAIARALIARPDLYVFDDAFSALDNATDAALRAALVPWTAGATVLIVAQRVGTIRNADRIVVLDGGAVVGTGTHEELVAGCGCYTEIVLSQLSAEEAAR